MTMSAAKGACSDRKKKMTVSPPKSDVCSEFAKGCVGYVWGVMIVSAATERKKRRCQQRRGSAMSAKGKMTMSVATRRKKMPTAKKKNGDLCNEGEMVMSAARGGGATMSAANKQSAMMERKKRRGQTTRKNEDVNSEAGK